MITPLKLVSMASELPAIMGQRVQLQEVNQNLIRNALDAMDTTMGSSIANGEDGGLTAAKRLSWK